MQITLQVPEDIARSLGADPRSIEQAALETLALEALRSGRLSRGQVRRLLGFQTRYELDGFLKAHGIDVQQTLADIQRDSDLVLGFE